MGFPNYFPKIQLEVTTKCNASCLYCARHKVIPSIRSLGDITPELVSIVVQRLAELNELQVSLSGLGEPLLYPGLIDLIQQIKQKCKRVTIRVNTNAILLKDELADSLIGVIDRLICGLNLPTREIYRKYKEVDNFKLVRDNIINFLHKKGNRRPATAIKLLDFDATHPYLSEAQRFWSQHVNRNDSCDRDALENWAGLVDQQNFHELPDDTRQDWRRNVRSTYCFYFDGRHLTITKEGNTYFCCFGIALSPDHPFNLGNIKDHSIYELLNSEKLRRLRLQHIEKKGFGPLECQYCNTKFKG